MSIQICLFVTGHPVVSIIKIHVIIVYYGVTYVAYLKFPMYSIDALGNHRFQFRKHMCLKKIKLFSAKLFWYTLYFLYLT
jgi:hypothetical protein